MPCALFTEVHASMPVSRCIAVPTPTTGMPSSCSVSVSFGSTSNETTTTASTFRLSGMEARNSCSRRVSTTS